MKTNRYRIIAICMIAAMVALPSSHAQRQLGRKKGPTSKLYIAETKGETQIQNGDKIYTARQATAFDAPGTVIETKAGAHNALVYSNGTGLFVDENTRVEIGRFVQEPFQADRDRNLDTPYEPSISHSNVFVSQGAIGVCTNQLVSGSSMLYSTPLASVNIRGGKISIETTPEATYVDLLEGDITVRGGTQDVGGQILRPGERATVVPSPGNGAPTITIGPIPKEALAVADERVQVACNAKKTVTFDVIERKAQEGLEQPGGELAGTGDTQPGQDEAAGAGDDTTQEIVANPTVPKNPPNNIVISPDRLPGT
jgi:hypothetical protein